MIICNITLATTGCFENCIVKIEGQSVRAQTTRKYRNYSKLKENTRNQTETTGNYRKQQETTETKETTGNYRNYKTTGNYSNIHADLEHV